MQHSIQIKKKTSFFSAFLLELKKLLGISRVGKPLNKKWPATITEFVKPRSVRNRRSGMRDRKKFIPMSYYHSLSIYGKINLVYRVTQFVAKNRQIFVTPAPPVTTIWSSYFEMVSAHMTYLSEDGSRIAHASLMEKEKELREMFQDLVKYVETIALDQSDYLRTAVIGDK